MSSLGALALWSAMFVGTHLLMSHPLRRPLVGALGEKGFAGVYSLVALATLAMVGRSYGAAVDEAPQPLWSAGEAGWIVATILMWLASVLLIGSFRRNPALPRPGRRIERIDAARGVFAITRHPMMWSFALWALTHALVNAVAASLIVSTAVAILALGGAAGQDRKKLALIGEPWRDWMGRTSFVPFGRGASMPDGFALVGGTLLWLGATWAHGALGYRPAGIWAFFA